VPVAVTEHANRPNAGCHIFKLDDIAGKAAAGRAVHRDRNAGGGRETAKRGSIVTEQVGEALIDIAGRGRDDGMRTARYRQSDKEAELGSRTVRGGQSDSKARRVVDRIV
jgi:hypothetical protein